MSTRWRRWSSRLAARKELPTGCGRPAVHTTCCWTPTEGSEVNTAPNRPRTCLCCLFFVFLTKPTCTCRMLQLYTALGLGTSVKKVLNFRNMLLYAEYVMDDMEFPRGLPSVQEDMFQVTPTKQAHTRAKQRGAISVFDYFSALFFAAGRRLFAGRTWQSTVFPPLSEPD